MESLDRLNDDVIREIATNLPYSEIRRLCGTSKRFRRIVCGNDYFWILRLEREYGINRVPEGYTPYGYYRELRSQWYMLGWAGDFGNREDGLTQVTLPEGRRIKDIQVDDNLAVIVAEDGSLWSLGIDIGRMFGGNLYREPTSIPGFEDISASSVALQQFVIFLLDTDGRVLVKEFRSPLHVVEDLSNHRIIEIQTNAQGVTMAMDSDRRMWISHDMESFHMLDLDFKVDKYSVGNAYYMLIDTAGNLYGSGNNNYGRLGLGDVDHTDNIVKITENHRVGWVSCGVNHTGVIDVAGNLWMTGSNGDGQLGSTGPIAIDVFRKVLVDASRVYCGSQDTVVIGVDGDVVVAGNNANNRLGVVGDERDIPFTHVPELHGTTAARLGKHISFVRIER